MGCIYGERREDEDRNVWTAIREIINYFLGKAGECPSSKPFVKYTLSYRCYVSYFLK